MKRWLLINAVMAAGPVTHNYTIFLKFKIMNKQDTQTLKDNKKHEKCRAKYNLWTEG